MDYQKERVVDTPENFLVCYNKVKNIWLIRWAIEPTDEQGLVQTVYVLHQGKPSIEEINEIIIEWYNRQIDLELTSGMTYEGNTVHLSTENQFNYKSAYDLAVQTGGKTLPITFKFGDNSSPVYREFTSMEDLSDFYMQASAFVAQTLAKGWQTKDQINWKIYEDRLKQF